MNTFWNCLCRMMNETAGMEGFGNDDSQMFGGNGTTPAESTTDLSKLFKIHFNPASMLSIITIEGYGQTLYKKGQNLGFGNSKDGGAAAAGNNNNGSPNKAELWQLSPEAQLQYF